MWKEKKRIFSQKRVEKEGKDLQTPYASPVLVMACDF